MGQTTAISWTDHTFNPWWGCARVSPGCQHCYAESFAKRTGHDVWGVGGERRTFGDKHWAEPLKWNRAAEAAGRPSLVFCASMADVFEDRDDLIPHRERLYDLIEATPHLIWQLLTKRPENVLAMTRYRYFHGLPDNVWIGCTVEDQTRAFDRIPELVKVPASVRFLSCEPLLGGVILAALDRIHWVIVGGESGGKHRPMDLDNARDIVHQCEQRHVPVFFKQVGGLHPTSGGDQLDGRTIKQFPKVAQRFANTA